MNVTDKTVTKDKKYIVYMHRNKINLKMYIGITSKNDPYKRWGNNGNNYKSQYFYEAIEKYGWDNFYHYILYTDLTENEAYEKEIELIEFYNTTDIFNGYNVALGGENIIENIKYTPKKRKKEKDTFSRTFICTYDNKTFQSKKEASKYYNISIGTIRMLLTGVKHFILYNNIEITFKYIDSH